MAFPDERALCERFAPPVPEAARRGLERIDVEYLAAGLPEPVFYVDDVPIPGAGSPLYLACHSHVLAAHGEAAFMRVTGLVAGERVTVYEAAVRLVGP